MQATLTVNPGNVHGGDAVTVSAYLTGYAVPATGADVVFTSDNGGTFSAVQEGNGYYNVTFTAPTVSQTAVCTLTVNASKDGWLDGGATVQVTVAPAVTPTATPTPTPTPQRNRDSYPYTFS